MEFIRFKKDVEVAFNNIISDNLFVVNVDKDLLWMTYLLSFDDLDEDSSIIVMLVNLSLDTMEK